MITVCLVDDHAVVRHGLRAFLDAQPDLQVTGEAASGKEAIQLAAELIPDVVLMDLNMPGMDGVEATRLVRQASPRTQVVVLTSYHSDEYIFPALRAGALSYLLKDAPLDDVAAAVRRAAAGEATLHPQVAARIVQEMHTSSAATPAHLQLTNRELDVLRLIAGGLANNEIAEKLVISENTVKGHVSNILSKLHLADRTQAAVYAWQQGLMRS